MSLNSMTGYTHISHEATNIHIDLELRSVNHRFLDLQFKMPEDLRFLENSLRENIAKQVARGKLECRIQLRTLARTNENLAINEDLVAQLMHINQKWRKQYKDLGKLNVAEILRFPNVLQSHPQDNENLANTISELLTKALEDFNAARRREGEKLAQHLLERLEAMESIIHQLSEIFPQLLQTHLDKTRHRLAEAVQNIDDDRLKQEFALFMQKADVDEEFSRLKTHITEVRRIVLQQKGSVGKRLDFLMQELNREANTLGSKAIAAECTQASVDLKVLIEQMREQVQNIE